MIMNTLLNTFRPLEAQIKQAELAYDVASQNLIDYSGTDPEACEALDAIVFNTYYAWKASIEAFNKAYYDLRK